MNVLLADRRVRGLLGAVGGVAGVLVLTQLIMPGGAAGTGTPVAVLFSGLVSGLLNALLAVGIVMVYRSHRIVNFAQAALGAGGATFTYNLAALAGWPYLLALVAGVVVAAGLAVAAEITFVRRFFNAPRLVLTVITGGMAFLLGQASGFILALPIFGNLQDRTIEELGGSADVGVPFGSLDFTVGRFPLPFGFGHILAIILSIGALAGLGAFLRFSRLGVAVRAVAENVDRAKLLGIGVGTVSAVVWAIAGTFGAVALIMQGTIQQQFSFFQDPFLALLIPMAAGVVGRMYSIPVTAGAAVGLTVLDQALRVSYERQNGLREVGLFAVILGGLLLQRELRRRSEEGETSSWQALQEQRPVPAELLQVGAIAVWRRVFVVAGVLFVLLVPWIATPRQTFLAGYYIVVALTLLSMTVLTGWAGQVSWGQFALVGVGAVVGGTMTARWGIPFWIALVLVPVLAAGVAMAVGLPALRIRGLFLGIVTLAFAYVVQVALFNESWFGWLLPERVDRPTLFLLDFEDERSMYYLLVAAGLLAVVAVTALRRSRTGRVLIALRDNEANAESFGINVVRMKLAAFALSGFLCGFAGVLLAHHQRAANDTLFPAVQSFFLFAIAVVGGVASVLGVVLGGAYFALTDLVQNPTARLVLGPVGIMMMLYAVPGGFASMALGARDAVLRIIAQRRQIIVPSLFADVDPADLERRLIPLSEPLEAGGLQSLAGRHYRRESDLYGARGRVGVGTRRRREEAQAFGAAAESFGETDGQGAERTT